MAKGARSHPHPLGKNHVGAQLPPQTPPTKKLSRGRSPKKYANKKIIPSKKVKQISNKVLTIMKIYSRIKMSLEKSPWSDYWENITNSREVFLLNVVPYTKVPERYMVEKKEGRVFL